MTPGAGTVRVVWSRRPMAALRRAAAMLGASLEGEMATGAYLHPNPLMRIFFRLRLRMLIVLINRLAAQGEVALGEVVDLGGGVGLMSGLLAPYARSVRLVELDCRAARLVMADLGAANVAFEEGDALRREAAGEADLVVAADVLEHFRELDPIIAAIRRWLRPGGFLLTSLPTENWCYRLLRLVFGMTKPADHYHTAAQVEAVLARAGFAARARLYHPLGIPLFPLFRITAWRRE
jgi:2-polyprenyl-3-methyl-5-hydroxy-6-metoxy-1,4-benzoquinol methylase